MYENQTYEGILNRALENVPQDIDKRQGSIIYDALAPACIEIAQMYVELDNMLELVFAHTSSGEYLDKRCNEIGITRKPATKAVRKGIFGGVVPPVGSRFNCGDLTYKVTNVSGGMSDVLLECEQVGSIGNENSGDLIPITEIPDLTSADLDAAIVIPGEDEESDEELLKRFNIRVKKSSTSGNVSHYMEWANEVGVGAVRVIPQPGDVKNSVKLLIVDSEMVAASDTLVQEVQKHIDPNSEGLGYGQAPIGACCTVEKAQSLTFNITADVSGVQPDSIQQKFKDKITEYFHTLITDNWQTQDSYKVSSAKIGAILLQIVGEASGDDYDNLVINGGTDSITLTDQIPVVGEVTLNGQA